MKRTALYLVFAIALAAPLALAQQPITVLNIGSTAAATGNGTSNAGDLRVNIASDNTAFQVKLLGNAGGVFDAAQNATAPANAIAMGCVFNSALPTITTGNLTAEQCDTKGQQLMDLNYLNGAAINTGNGTAAASLRVAIASDNTAYQIKLLGNTGAVVDFAGQNAASPANAILMGGQFNTSPTTLSSGNVSPFQLDSGGLLKVNCTGCSAGSVVSLNPATTGGLTIAHTVSAGSTNATSTKASAGQVYHACVNSVAQYPVFLKLYNKATAPTVGTDTPVRVLEAQAGVPVCIQTEEGFTFGTGIGWAMTKGIADADATAVLASDASVELAYK